MPVGFLEADGKLIVVAEDGLSTLWVRNALDRKGRLRVFFRGHWPDAQLAPRPGDPEVYLRRMNKTHAALVRMESSIPELVDHARIVAALGAGRLEALPGLGRTDHFLTISPGLRIARR